MHPRPHSQAWLILILGLLWLGLRAYPFSQVQPLSSWETWQCRKLLEYGFWERHGALIQISHEAGLLPHPERFNYIDHPLPSMWLLTGVFALCGPWGVLIFTAALKLAAFLAFFWALAQVVPTRAAFWACAIFATGAMPMLMDMDPNQITLSALLWPFALCVLQWAKRMPERQHRLPWIIGMLVFGFGQVDWMSLMIIPALLAATWRVEHPFRWSALLRECRENRCWRGILVGAACTAVLFAAQVLYYSPNLWADLQYVLTQTGAPHRKPKWEQALLAAARGAVYLGLPLLCLGSWGLLRSRSMQHMPWRWAAVVYLCSFLTVGAVLTHYFYVELSPLVFVGYLLTTAAAHAIPHLRPAWLVYVAWALMLPHLAYGYLQAATPVISRATEQLGHTVAANTAITDVVLTNLALGEFPFAASESFTTSVAQRVGNRLIRFGIRTPEDLSAAQARYTGSTLVFLRAEGVPMAQALAAALPVAAKHVVLELPAATPTIAQRWRVALWRLTGKFSSGEETSLPARQITLELHRLAPSP